MGTGQILYCVTLLIDLLIISVAVYVVYAIVKAVKRHFRLLADIQHKLDDIQKRIDKN